MKTVINRRQFLQGVALFAAAGSSTLCRGTTIAESKPQAVFTGSCLIGNKPFWVAIDVNGQLIARVALPYRGHGVIPLPGGEGCLLMGRSPSRYGLAITRLHGSPTECWFEAMDGRHFHGHACFSQDGTRLYTTENDYASGAGKLGVRLVAENFRQVDEMDMGGIGPHDLLLMPDGKHLVVAMGGIQTHPDQPDSKLNLDTMVSGLHYVNPAKGTISSRHDCPYPQLSVRHLTLDKHGKVWFGCQYEGLATDRVPLAGTHTPVQPGLQFIQAEEQDTWRSHRQYVGSVAYCTQTGMVAMTSPKGSCISFWQSHPLAKLGQVAADDICAIAALSPEGGWIAGTGKGQLIKIAQGETVTTDTTPIQWDNHAIATSIAAGTALNAAT